jgi:hypothetical protein
MRRREFISLIGARPSHGRWSLAERPPFIVGTIGSAPHWRHFREAMRDLGYREGQNVNSHGVFPCQDFHFVHKNEPPCVELGLLDPQRISVKFRAQASLRSSDQEPRVLAAMTLILTTVSLHHSFSMVPEFSVLLCCDAAQL